MAPSNPTKVSEFFILGFSEEPALQPLIFGLFLSMYLVTVFGNLLIILMVSSDSHLHFFLSNLSFVDICFTSTTIPKMLQNIWKESKAITYEGCITQMHFFILFAGLDDFLLTVMAYDRFVTICHPLHYTVIMNPQLCVILVLVSWVVSVLDSLLQTFMISRLSFCRDVLIPHYFCELKWLVQLACSENLLNEMVMYFAVGLLGSGPFAGIFYSYCKIASSICGISSAQGKYKAFIFTHSAYSSTIASVMYTVVTPMLNTFIYSLRNKDIKRALSCGRFILIFGKTNTIM